MQPEASPLGPSSCAVTTQPRMHLSHATPCPLSTFKANSCGGSWGLRLSACAKPGTSWGARKAWDLETSPA